MEKLQCYTGSEVIEHIKDLCTKHNRFKLSVQPSTNGKIQKIDRKYRIIRLFDYHIWCEYRPSTKYSKPIMESFSYFEFLEYLQKNYINFIG